MSMTREEVLAEIAREIEENKPQPDDLFTSDLIKMGMDNTAAEKRLNAMVETGERRIVSVVVKGRRRNAYRAV